MNEIQNTVSGKDELKTMYDNDSALSQALKKKREKIKDSRTPDQEKTAVADLLSED